MERSDLVEIRKNLAELVTFLKITGHMAFGGILGGNLAYVMLSTDLFYQSPYKPHIFVGGIIGGVVTGGFYAIGKDCIDTIKKYKTPKTKKFATPILTEETKVMLYEMEDKLIMHHFQIHYSSRTNQDSLDKKIFRLKKKLLKTTRCGRTILHEAVAMRNIKLVKKYATNDDLMNQTDNNGHTPLEMAYFQDYKEALIVFEAVLKRKLK